MNNQTNLEKILVSSNKEQENVVLDNANKLLLAQSTSELQILNDLGLGKRILEAQNKHAQVLTMQGAKNKYGYEVFTYEQLLSFGCKYRLFLRKANRFIGEIPSDLPAELVKFKQDNNLNINGSMNSDGGRFFILAPPHMFDNYESFVTKHINEVKETPLRYKAYIESFKDPILFYKDSETDMFVKIKAWGNDFTPYRRILGALTVTEFWSRFYYALLYFIPAIITLLFTDYLCPHSWRECAVVVLSTIIVFIVTCMVLSTTNGTKRKYRLNFSTRKNFHPNTPILN